MTALRSLDRDWLRREEWEGRARQIEHEEQTVHHLKVEEAIANDRIIRQFVVDSGKALTTGKMCDECDDGLAGAHARPAELPDTKSTAAREAR